MNPRPERIPAPAMERGKTASLPLGSAVRKDGIRPIRRTSYYTARPSVFAMALEEIFKYLSRLRSASLATAP